MSSLISIPTLPLVVIALICGILSFISTRLVMPWLIYKLEKAEIIGKDIHKSSRPIVAEMGGMGIIFGPKTTGYLLKQYCIGIVQVFRGETYQNALGILESCTLALAVGLKQACGREFLKCCHMKVTTNMPCWTQPLCVLINTVPEKKRTGNRTQ